MRIPNLKKEISALYTGTAKVYDFVYEVTERGAKVKSSEPKLVIEGLPCRLSYSSKVSTNQDTFGEVQQEVALLCDPSARVRPGAMVEVTQAGATEVYECAGQPASYTSHQEIRLKIRRKRA